MTEEVDIFGKKTAALLSRKLKSDFKNRHQLTFFPGSTF